jgi:hypothetical protein
MPLNLPLFSIYLKNKLAKIPSTNCKCANSFSDFIDHSKDGGWASLCRRINLVKCEADHEGILGAEFLQTYRHTLHSICQHLMTRANANFWLEYPFKFDPIIFSQYSINFSQFFPLIFCIFSCAIFELLKSFSRWYFTGLNWINSLN